MRLRLLGGILGLGLSLLAAAFLAGPTPGAPARASKKGGTLRVDLRSDFDFVDPALSYFGIPREWQMEYLTGMKLLNYPDKEGTAGMRLVPDAAAAMPKVSRDGKTYTFTLKTNIRFSNGALLTARNFSYAIDRDADPKMSSPAIIFMEDIVGENAVRSGKATHVSGVRVLSKFKLQFRLLKSAPDFPLRIATPFFCAVPVGLPHDPNGVMPPLASAGPYYVASWNHSVAVLKRNKFYVGSRPNNPDEIDFNLGIDLAAQRLRAESNQTDVAGFPPAAAAELKAKYGVNKGRFFVQHKVTFWYLALNHESPLFKDNPKLARAVNYAVDRPALVSLNGALGGAPTGQILQPGMLGFAPYKIYPLNGPKVAEAKKLAKRHLRGGKCRFWTFNSGFGPGVAQVVQFDLMQIGLNCDITPLDRVVETTKAGTRGAAFDMLLNGWGEDYPDPYDFINTLLSGTSIEPRNNVNLSYFNNPTWNTRMAATAQLAGPARNRAYAKLDHDLMKGPAPIVPLFVTEKEGTLVSPRVGCFLQQPIYGVDLGALCLNDIPPPPPPPPPAPPECTLPPTLQLNSYTDSYGSYEIQIVGQCAGLGSGSDQIATLLGGSKQIYGYTVHTSGSCSAIPSVTLGCPIKADNRICMHLHLGLMPGGPGDALDIQLRKPDHSLFSESTQTVPMTPSPPCNPRD